MSLKYALLGGVLAGLFGAPIALAQAPAENMHVINLTDVDIKTLIEDVSVITGYAFVVHPDVRARVTVSSQVPMSDREVFEVFLSTLRVNEFTAVPAGRNTYSIVPESFGTSTAGNQMRGNNNFSTQIIRLEHFDAVEAAKMVQPLLSRQGQVSVSQLSNNLIIVEYGSNLLRIRELVSRLDKDNTITKTVTLKRISANEVKTIITELNAASRSQARSNSALSAISAESSNSIILRGLPSDIDRVMALIEELDTVSSLRRDTQVFRLSHTDAATVEPILREIAESLTQEADEARGLTTSISVHDPSNSIIVSAVPETMGAMSRVVAELDVRSKQVLVEAIIVEVSDSAIQELGLQFLVSGTDGDVPFVSSTFSQATPNLLSLTGAIASNEVDGAFGEGASDLFQQAATSALLGLTGGTFGFGGTRDGSLFSVVFNALKNDQETNILSTPQVMALNYQESLVSVGQDIPVTVGESLGASNSNAFRTTERREIGVILNVTPRIGEDGTIRLDIDQEVSSIAATVVGPASSDFILNKSQVKTTVIADDGELIVLGGLIKSEEALDEDKVPLLGDIPFLGRAFRNETKSRETSNLMVFIRPTIIDDRETAESVTQRTYNYIRAQQILANDGGPTSLDAFLNQMEDQGMPLEGLPTDKSFPETQSVEDSEEG